MPLKGVPKCLSPEILHTLSSMGHGDEVNFRIIIEW